MSRYFEYLDLGFCYLKRSVSCSILIYGVIFAVLFFTKKRKPQKDKIWKYIFEYIFILWICVILKTTGIYGAEFQFSPSMDTIMKAFTSVPFQDASIRMVILNLLLFVPYGFLFPIAVKTDKWTWYKAFIAGIVTSLSIETLQLFVGRLFELDDILANSFGTLAGYVIWQSLQEIRKKEIRGIVWKKCRTSFRRIEV